MAVFRCALGAGGTPPLNACGFSRLCGKAMRSAARPIVAAVTVNLTMLSFPLLSKRQGYPATRTFTDPVGQGQYDWHQWCAPAFDGVTKANASQCGRPARSRKTKARYSGSNLVAQGWIAAANQPGEMIRSRGGGSVIAIHPLPAAARSCSTCAGTMSSEHRARLVVRPGANGSIAGRP